MSKRHYITALIVILLTALLLAGCKPQTPDNLPARIEIYGDAEQAILIDYRIRAHGETIESVRLPWRKDFTINVDDVERNPPQAAPL